MSRLTLNAVAFAVTSVASAGAAAQALHVYKVEHQRAGCQVAGITATGQIVGTHAQGFGIAFITNANGKGLRELTQPDDAWSKATGTNSLGAVFGIRRDVAGYWHSYVTDADGQNRHDIAAPPGLSDFSPIDINDAGYLLGWGDEDLPVLLHPNGQEWQRVKAPANATDVIPLYLNNRNQVAGWAKRASGGQRQHSFVTGEGAVRPMWLAKPSAARTDRVQGLNDAGQVAVNVKLNGGARRGAISGPGPSEGQLIDFEPGVNDNFNFSGIDAHGMAYGSVNAQVNPPFDYRTYGFTTNADLTLTDVNTRIVNLPAGLQVTGVIDVNASGQMAASGNDMAAGGALVCLILCPTEHCEAHGAR